MLDRRLAVFPTEHAYRGCAEGKEPAVFCRLAEPASRQDSQDVGVGEDKGLASRGQRLGALGHPLRPGGHLLGLFPTGPGASQMVQPGNRSLICSVVSPSSSP